MKYNTIAEMREILDAIEQGKQIQFYMNCGWSDTKNVHPNFGEFAYRIKPEEPKKKWRPFKDVDEFLKAAGGLGAIWIKPRTGNQKQLVTSISTNDCSHPIHSGFSWKSYKDLLEDYTFADGTPCGVEEDA